jgi:flagellar hook-basal body complex protein FliE
VGGLRVGDVPQVSADNSREIKHNGATGFGDIVKGAITKVSSLEKQADSSIIDMLQGKADISQTMIALQKADISMRLVLTVRNKVIQAYREIMNMQF